MIEQLNIYGKTKVEVAIERLKAFEPPDGFYLAFSGGKDSVAIKKLANMAQVKYDAHYNVTSVDSPELIYFIRKHHPDVIWDYPRYPDGTRITMWDLIVRKGFPPTRKIRYCCEKLKETGGKGRFVVTGVRWAESARRANSRAGLEIGKGRKREHFDPDNPDNAQLTEFCPTKGSFVLNPIIDWSNEDVWEFIKYYQLPYCCLYDEGYTRLGCIGCPMSNHQEYELERYPKFKSAYLRAFDRMIERRLDNGLETHWKTGKDVMKWWLM